MSEIKNTSELKLERYFIELVPFLKEKNDLLYIKYQFLNNPKYWIRFCFRFTPYLKQIKNNKYKYLHYVKTQGSSILSALLQESSDLLVWNCDDGWLDMKVNKVSIKVELEVSKLLILTTLKKKETLIKIINTLQEMKFLKLLKTSKKGHIHIKLNLTQIDQSMRLVEKKYYYNNKRCIENFMLLSNIIGEVVDSTLKTTLT
jgi:hypothetical protein